MNELKFISPTKNTIRIKDDFGSGQFNASRGKDKHNGIDFICTPGQVVIAPVDGVVKRKAYPYKDKDYCGVLIDSGNVTMKLFYLEPDISLIGKKVSQGDRIGIAQDISRKYNRGTLRMQPHIHMEIERINPLLLFK